MSSTESPTENPTPSPSANPTKSPTLSPSSSPSGSPTVSPTTAPSTNPSTTPSQVPSEFPSESPTAWPSTNPSSFPSTIPSSFPSDFPSYVPSYSPSSTPSGSPELSPTTSPSAKPTAYPSKTPSISPSRSPVIPCGKKARKVKIDSTTDQSIHVFEVQVFSSGRNVALSKTATQSSTFESFDASHAVDGSASSFSHTDNGDSSPWWEVDLGALYPIENVQILNRYCEDPSDPSACLCRLSNATLSLVDENNLVVATKSLGDTCGVMNVGESFADPDIPSCMQAVVIGSVVDSKSSSQSSNSLSQTDSNAGKVGPVVNTFVSILGVGVFLGLAILALRGRKRIQRQMLQQRRDSADNDTSNISPYVRKVRRQRSQGLDRKTSGEHVLNQLEDNLVWVNVQKSPTGGWNCSFDEDALEQLDLRPMSANSVESITPGSLQDLEEIENVHNKKIECEKEEATDEELLEALQAAMAIDIEPENEAAVALAEKYSKPGFGEQMSDAALTMPSLGHEIT